VTLAQIVEKPIITEKGIDVKDRARTLVFRVNPHANKVEIKKAIEEIFNVSVTNVNTLNRRGKRKQNRRTGAWGKRADQKRAIVSLADGDRIEIFGS